MQIKQWKDQDLSQFSYAVLSDCEKKIMLIDPVRNPQQYLNYAAEMNASITGIIETHPHADFISGHAEIAAITGAMIYTGHLVDAAYPHTRVYDGNVIEFGKMNLTVLDTPGHSPDSISILLTHNGREHAIFSGDALFIGDCGRPDLREGAGNIKSSRLELAKNMYTTLRNKFLPLNDNVILYPAHGAGTLCGKNLGDADSSSMGEEKKSNWSLQPMTEEDFVQKLLNDQPFVPAYFPFDVELNRKGARGFQESINAIKSGATIGSGDQAEKLDKNILIVDGRSKKEFASRHVPNSVNLMNGIKFQTWLGSIIKPNEPFFLAGENGDELQQLIERAATIGYEAQIKEAFVLNYGSEIETAPDIEAFKQKEDNYTIVDVRNISERKEGGIFRKSISIPLHELRDRIKLIPTDKPIIVHCAGGYRSAAGSSIIRSAIGGKVKVYDLGEAVQQFQKTSQK